MSFIFAGAAVGTSAAVGVGAGAAAAAAAATAATAAGATAAAATAAGAAAAAGSAGVIAGGVAGGALGGALGGAALGAGTAALTGQDVGKGALMGGVGGAVGGGLGVAGGAAGSALGASTGAGTVGGTAIGALAGAAGGAAGSAAGGQDPATGALIGGATGGIGGYLKGAPGSEGLKVPSEGTALANATGTTETGASAAGSGKAGIAGVGTGDYGLTGAAPNPLGASGTAALNNAIPAASVPVADISSIPTTPVAEPNMLQKGIDLIKEHPAIAMQLGGAGLAMLGGSGTQKDPTKRPVVGVTNVSPDFQRTVPIAYRPTLVNYAEGGIAEVQPQAQPQAQPEIQGPINPMVARAMQAVQEHLASQAPQGQPQQVLPPQQGIQPMQAPQPMQAQQAPYLGAYAHGGIAGLLSGPGTGVSDDIPAEVGHKEKQRVKLASGEFIFPARAVSELGNGSTEAGGRILQAAVDKIQARRAKTTGKGKIAVNSKAANALPA